MSLLDKLKFLMQLRRTLREISMLEKLKNGMAKLDGWKSTIGLLMVVGYYMAPNWNVHLPDAVLKIGSTWAAVGLSHKLDKATGILTVILQILSATKESVNQGEVKK